MFGGVYFGAVGYGQIPILFLVVSIIAADETESIILDVEDREATLQLSTA